MPTFSSSPPPAGETPRDRNNRIVTDLSARVVSGWTLLASTCPICQTALVRSKDGQTYCVGCRMVIVTEAEARQRNISPAPAGSSPHAAMATGAASVSRPASAASAASTLPTTTAPPASPPVSSARSPSSRATSLSPTQPTSAVNGTPSPPLPASAASQPSSSASPFSMFRTDAMSTSAPPREESGAPGLRSLASSPHYSQLMDQIAKAQQDNTPRAAQSLPASSSTPAAPPVPTAADAEASEATERAVSSRVRRTNSLSARLGEKMMAGWTLLGIHCPIDHCPLMKNPRTGDMLCVDCGTVYPASGGESAAAASASSGSAASVSTSASAPSTSSSSLVAVSQQPVVAFVNGSGARAQSPALPSTINSSSGMVPRPAQPDRRVTEESNTDDDDEDDDSDERLDRLAAARLGRVNGSPHADTNGSPPPRPAAATVNDVSAALSEKMLQGWTMLAVECPNATCACPLVRKKQGPMLCVQCGSTVVTQEEKDRMDAEERKQSASGAGAAEQKAIEAKVAEEKAAVQQKESKESTKQVDSSKQQALQPQAKKENEERSGSRSAKRTAFADEQDTGRTDVSEKRLKNEDDLSDRLSALSSSSLVHSLSSSPLIRQPLRPTAISSTRRQAAPPLVDASPSTHTPPSTPAPFPFASPLPASQHLSASISSAFSNHPVFPPPGLITRHNSMASNADTSSGLPHHASVGVGNLLFSGGPVSQPHARVAGTAHERGKFSFRSSSAAAAVSQPHATGASLDGGGGGLLSAPQSGMGEGGGMGVPSPVTVSPADSDNGVTVAMGSMASMGSVRPAPAHSTVVSSSVDALYGKLDALRGQLVSCTQVDGMQQIAVAMKEIGQALKVLQTL